ncbi:hypothetical protein AAHC03_013314 [Spirometra sp. Aus1]
MRFKSSPRKKELYNRVEIGFANGNTYEGDLCNLMMHGSGRYTWTTLSAFYVGVFQYNQVTGSGILVWRNGSCYIGDLKRGCRDGYGIQYYISPSVLQKETEDQDSPSKETLESLYHSKYAGYWKDGLKSGKGRMDYSRDNSSFYDGNWLDGKPNGVGYRRYTGGSIYEGQWVDGLRHGFGELKWPERCECYSGEWRNGKQHGKGLYVWQIPRTKDTQYPSRNAYYGDWVAGKWEGEGVFFYPNGAKCMGRWRDGRLNGRAFLELKNGEIIEAEFANDSIVRILHNGVPENDVLFADPRIQAILPLQDVLGMTTDTKGQYECVTLDTTEIDLREDFFVYKCKHKLDWPNELLKMRNGLFASLKILRHTYRFYAGLGVDRTADNTQLLQRMQFWQFLRDCRFTTSMSICQVLNILVKGFGDCDASRKMFQPFEPMFFSEFTSSIAILAVTLFHEYDTAPRAPHEAVKHFVDKFVSRNACVPLGGVYAQPQRTAVLTPYFNDLYKLFEICPGTLSFPPKDEVMTVRVFVKMLQKFKILDSFVDLRQLLGLIGETHPRVQTMGTFNLNSRGTIECISRGSVDMAGASEGRSIPRTKSDFKNTTKPTEKERRKPPTEGEREVTAGRRISTNQNTNSKTKSRRETSTTQRGKKERPDSSINKLQSRRRGSHSLKSEQDVPAQDSSDQDGEISRQGTTLKKETETEVPPFLRWQQMVKTFISERLLAQAEVQLDKWAWDERSGGQAQTVNKGCELVTNAMPHDLTPGDFAGGRPADTLRTAEAQNQ